MINTSDYDQVFTALKNRNNVFITGSAGAGKSYLASQYAKTAPYSVLTATTGVAALNLGGETIHRFLGIGISSRPDDAGKIIGKWEKIKKSSSPWDVTRWQTIQKLNTLIIDEVSMLRRDQFELIDIVLSYIKDNPLPFGGISIILSGDFFQLPPVVTEYDAFKFSDLKEPYCFQSEIWNNARFESYNLTSNYRQGDGPFLAALEKIRVGDITKEVEDLLNSRVNANLNIPFEPVKLFSHKIDVSRENLNCLKLLPGEKYVSEAEFDGKEFDIEILKKECPAENRLYFCKGAQIMMLTNDVTGRWVNGTMGIIRDVSPLTIQLSDGLTVSVDMHTWERNTYRIDSKTGNIITIKTAAMKQYPMRLSWATTIHKSQSLTMDYVSIDLSKCYTSGQAYTALSRCKTLNGITLTGFNKKSIFANNIVKQFYGTI